MDRAALIHRRKKRYMAQVLTTFEEKVERHLPPGVAEDMKGIIRQKFHALALDSAEIVNLAPGEELNGAAVELRDQLQRTSANRSARA